MTAASVRVGLGSLEISMALLLWLVLAALAALVALVAAAAAAAAAAGPEVGWVAAAVQSLGNGQRARWRR